MEKLIQIRPGVFEEAVYKEQVILEYRNNPFIESLPEILSKEEVIERLYYYPHFDKSERNLDSQYRLHILGRLFQYYQVLPLHVDLEGKISRIIRQGYLNRNPLSKEFVIKLNQAGRFTDKITEGDCSSGMGITVIGASGTGKTKTINKILSLYPTVIAHSSYHGYQLSQYQLVWIKVDCPHDGSIKGICLDILMQVDKALGTTYYNSSKNSATNSLIPVLSKIVLRSGLGLLVIDEIQNISLLKSGGQERFLNFFMTLMNTIGVPVVLIGTNKAMAVLQNQFRQARRCLGQGVVFFERIKSKEDDSWDLFVQGLFGYQWVRKSCLLTSEISDLLHLESQGVFDIAVKLYVMCQIRAIVTNKEEITANLIKQTAKEHLKLVKPMLDALRTGSSKVAMYDDIAPIEIDEFMSLQENQININDKIREIQQLKRRESISDNHIREEAIARLIELDVEPLKAKKNVEVVLKENTIINVKEIVKLAYRMTIEDDKVVSKKGKKEKAIQSFDEKDLRYIVAEGKKRELSAYQALLGSGNIKPNLL